MDKGIEARISIVPVGSSGLLGIFLSFKSKAETGES